MATIGRERSSRPRNRDGGRRPLVSIGSLVSSGPLLLAIPVAAAAGAVTFLSPCVLPLVPGYLSYITGMSGSAVADGGTGNPGAPVESAGGADGVAGSGGRPSAPAAGTAAAVLAAPAKRRAPARPARRRAVLGAALFVLGFSALFATYGAAFGTLGTTVHSHARGLSQILGVVLILLGLLFAGAFDRFSFSGRIVKPALRPKA